MNFLELANFACLKSGQAQTSDLAAAKQFVAQRYELIYASYLWKDSLGIFPVAFDPANENNAEGIVLLPEDCDRVAALRTNFNAVQISALESFYRVDYNAFTSNSGNQWGCAQQFAILSPIWFKYRGADGLGLTGEDGDFPVKIKVLWRDADGLQHIFDGDLEDDPHFDSSIVEVEAMFKGISNSPIGFIQWAGGTIPGLLATTDTASPKYQRIRLFAIPTQALTLNVLAKRRVIKLTMDDEVPLLRNLDNCLIALATGDMWSRARQLGKAQQFYAEGAALLQELVSLECVQAANFQQIVPVSGYGDIYFTAGGSGSGFLFNGEI